ncbi:MAG: hypothetical protein ACRDPY_21225 [Streptosporangiaceae bacterium]
MNPDIPHGPGLFAVDTPGGQHITNVRRIAGTGRDPGSLLIGWSTVLLALLDAGLFYISWWGQYLFIYAARHQDAPAMIEAAMFDTGQVIFTGLSLGLARKGRPAKTERFLIQACAAASAAMNYAAADTSSPRSIVAFTAAPVFAAIVTDRVVSVVRRHALGIDEPSAWKGLARFLAAAARAAALTLLYALRLCLAFRETAAGMRQAVLDAAPLPQPPVDDVTPTKKAILLAAYRAAPEYGLRSAASQVAARLAPLADLQPGTARSYVYAELARLEGESA